MLVVCSSSSFSSVELGNGSFVVAIGCSVSSVTVPLFSSIGAVVKSYDVSLCHGTVWYLLYMFLKHP